MTDIQTAIIILWLTSVLAVGPLMLRVVFKDDRSYADLVAVLLVRSTLVGVIASGLYAVWWAVGMVMAIL